MDERKLVSVLFCDVVGSTALAAQLDPEEWAEIIRAAFPCLIEPVERYGGTVARLMGDAILAFFGAPSAHEDDAQRAVLAGLGILDSIQPLRDEVRRDYGLELNVRVGINTGDVIVGEFGTDRTFEYTAMGDAVNIAARMEQTAAPGTVQITDETYRQVYPFFTTDPLGPIDVKGKGEPVAAYRVTGRVSRQAVARGELGAPLIGRDRELAALRTVAAEAVSGRGGICALIGEAGLGKSRLIDALCAEWRQLRGGEGRGDIVEDYLVSYETSAPYALIRERVCAGLQLPDDAATMAIELAVSRLGLDDPAARARATRAIKQLFSTAAGREHRAVGQVESNGAMLDAVEFRHELVELTEQLWRSWVSACGAGLYVVDDFHHADAASAEILEAVLSRVSDLPLMIVLAFRPEQRSAAWSTHTRLGEQLQQRYTNLHLAPLDDRQTAGLVDTLLSGAHLPPAFRIELLARVDGNPLYAAEIVRSLIGRGLIEREGGGTEAWRIAAGADLTKFTIPPTLQGLMQERMDRLSAAEKQTLHLASVIGRTFSYDELAAAAEEPNGLDSRLAALERAMLLRDTSSGNGREISFHHALTRDAAYQTILHRRRRQLHLSVGEALERVHADRLDEHADLLAYHFAEARDARAVPYAVASGRRAEAVFAYAAAVEAYSRALMVAHQLGLTLPLDAYQGRGEAQVSLGKYELARQDLQAALDLARGSGDSHAEWQALLQLGLSWEGIDYEQAGVWYRLALEHAQAMDNELYVAWSLTRVGNWYSNVEDIDAAAGALHRALSIFRAQDVRRGVAECLDLLGTLADIAGDLAGMYTYLVQAKQLFEELDWQVRLASVLANLSYCSGVRVFDVVVPVREFDADRRLEHATRSLAIAQSIEALSEEVYAYLTLGMIYDSHGEVDEARRNVAAGLAIAERLEHAEWLTMGHAGLGWIALTVLDFDDAAHEFEIGYALAQASGSRHFTQIMGAFYAYTLMQTGQLERAEALLYPDAPPPTMRTISGRMLWLSRADLALARSEPHAALEIVEKLYASALNLSDPGDIPQLAWRRAQALIGLGNHQGAYGAIAAAVQRARERGFDYDVWRMHVELGRLLTIAGDTAGAEREFATGRTDLHRLAGSIADEHERTAFLERAQKVIGRTDGLAATG